MEAPWLDELGELLRIPSVSADPARADDVRRAGEWVCERIRAAGGEAELVVRGGQPLALGDVPASRGTRRAPTVLVYGHFDVQPPDPLEAWASPPFEPTVRDGWLYARGVADDKGQLFLLLKAAEQLAAEGALPVNVRFACDGEEETGGHTIVDALAEDERRADAAVVFDSSMLRRGVPVFNVATRGVVYYHLRLRTGARDLHSGLFGGAALNALHALLETLRAVLPVDGRLPEPLRRGAAPPTPEELDDWARLPSGAQVLAEAEAAPLDARAAEELYLRTWAEPAVDVHGIAGGSPHLQKTVLPVEAEANLSIRLAPGQRIEEVAPELERLLREAVPAGASLELERWSAAAPGLVPADAPAVQLALGAFEAALGVRPLLIRTGGTLPIVPALVERGVPVVVTGFDLPEGNVHAPNERLLLEHVPLGVAAARELFRAWGGLSATR